VIVEKGFFADIIRMARGKSRGHKGGRKQFSNPDQIKEDMAKVVENSKNVELWKGIILDLVLEFLRCRFFVAIFGFVNLNFGQFLCVLIFGIERFQWLVKIPYHS
jgi:hypothetical protein